MNAPWSTTESLDVAEFPVAVSSAPLRFVEFGQPRSKPELFAHGQSLLVPSPKQYGVFAPPIDSSKMSPSMSEPLSSHTINERRLVSPPECRVAMRERCSGVELVAATEREKNASSSSTSYQSST